MGPIIIPSKPGSIIPYSNQLPRVFLTAHIDLRHPPLDDEQPEIFQTAMASRKT